MKAVQFLGVGLILVGAIACSEKSASPIAATPAAAIDNSATAGKWQKKNIVWGTTPGSGGAQVGVNPSSVAIGTNVTGYAQRVDTNGLDFDLQVTLGYGSRVSGPSTVTIPANSMSVTFTVHTNGTGSDASVQGVTFAGNSTLSGSVNGSTIIWSN